MSLVTQIRHLQARLLFAKPVFKFTRGDDTAEYGENDTKPYNIDAFDSETGERMGGVGFVPSKVDPDYLEATMASVEPKYRRQGLATHLYDAIEKQTGKRIIPSTSQISDGGIKQFWVKRRQDQKKGLDWFSKMPDQEKKDYLKKNPGTKVDKPMDPKYYGDSQEAYVKNLQTRRLQEIRADPKQKVESN